jgi:hypothetical protein
MSTQTDFPGTGQVPSFPWKYLFKEVGPRTQAKKRRNGLCKHWGCNNATIGRQRDCNTCKGRKTRINNPKRYAFQQVKRSADMRNIPFELTFEEFLEFDKQTGYVASKGREKESLTIDRIESSKGYEVGNIRAITWQDNCAKKLEGMIDPLDPIAKALCLASGADNWHKFKKQASEVLYQVELLQAQEDGGFDPPKEEPCPF